MVRLFGVLAAAAAATLSCSAAADGREAATIGEQGTAAPRDVGALLAAARGASPVLCALAARAVGNGDWGRAADAPAPPLADVLHDAVGPDQPSGDDDDDRGDRRRLPDADVARLLDGIGAEDACVREVAARLIGQQDAERVGPPLIARLTTPGVAPRAAAAFALGLAEVRGAVDPLARTLRDAAPGVRANAAWALGRIGDGRSLAPLVAHVGDDEALVRGAIIAAVGRFESTSTAGLLGRVLRQDASPEVRRVAAWALGQLERAEVGPPLLDALARDADPRVREMAAWAIGAHDRRDGNGNTAALVAALRGDSSAAVRETAAWALGTSEDATGADALGTAAASDRSARVRGTAAWALGQSDRNGAPPGLVRAVRDPDADVRLKAAWALGQIGDPAAAPVLREALGRETSARARRAQVRALLRSGEHSQPVMNELLASADPQVREAAVRGLVGKDAFGPWPWPWPRPRPFP